MTQALTLGGTVVGASFALVKFALGQNRATTDRFTAFLERSLGRQEEANERFRLALESLTASVRDTLARLERRGS